MEPFSIRLREGFAIVIEILTKAPDFTAYAYADGAFRALSLGDFRGGWVVLFFYPRDFSYVCPTEIMELERRLPEFEALGFKAVGISCDSEFSHRAWARELGVTELPLAADFEKQISRSYGVLLEGGFPARATIVIDPEGIVRHVSVNPPETGRSIAELLRIAEALKLGAMTPVEWHRGEPTLEED